MEGKENVLPRQASNIEDDFDIKNFFFACVAEWRLFLLAFVLFIGGVLLYLATKQPIYTRTLSVMIKDDTRKGASIDATSMFNNIGIGRSRVNVNNELLAFSSPDVAVEVARMLDLDVIYSISNVLRKDRIYGDKLPINVVFLNPSVSNIGFDVEFMGGEKIVLTNFKFKQEGKFVCLKDPIELVLPTNDTIATPVGNILIKPTTFFEKRDEKKAIHVWKSSIQSATKMVLGVCTLSLSDEESSVVDITCRCPSIVMADNILNAVLSAYNKKWVEDRNQIAYSTSLFINERLKVIEKDLGIVDADISTYKSEHFLPDVNVAGNLAMTQEKALDDRIVDINNQIYMARFIKDYLLKVENKKQLLPTNSGIKGSGIEDLIQNYNEKLLQRNNLVANSSETNPLIVDIDVSLGAMRDAILRSIDNEIATLNLKLRSQQDYGNQTAMKIKSNPQQAKYLLSVERQQKVKEALYLFLLQKREENELNQAFTAYNTRIISSPNGPSYPTGPNRKKYLLLAFALSLVLPMGFIYIREELNTSVRGKADIDKYLTIPYLGEIPLYYTKRGKISWIFGKKKKTIEEKKLLVKAGYRDVFNEAFRVIRTNIEFMITNKHSNVIAITSYNPGSGKSFISMNLAISFAIKERKVLVIDADMRHATVSAHVGSPSIGLSNYLSGKVENMDKIISPYKDYPNFLHVLPVGSIPPNPTELLFSPKFEKMITDLRSEYDFIFIDCPPIDIVADTTIVEKFADRTFFIIRAGMFERDTLPQLEKEYKEQKYKEMAVILNGTLGEHGKYGYRYGYKYGYKYGYHYGYHSYYHSQKANAGV